MHEVNLNDEQGNSAENKLFQEWSKDKDIKPGFSDDGIVCMDEFDSLSPRIVIVLKEVNAGQGFSLRSFLRNGACNENGYKDGSHTWAPVQRWLVAYAKKATEGGNPLGFPIKPGKENRAAALRRIAAINLKKTPGGRSNNKVELENWVKENWKRIIAQMQCYNDKPTVFVCGGKVVFEMMRKIFAMTEDSKWGSQKKVDGFLKMFDNCIAFDVGHHPQGSSKDVHDKNFVESMEKIRGMMRK